jgi:hypothetical protein
LLCLIFLFGRCNKGTRIYKYLEDYFLFTECKLSEEKALEQLDLFNDVKVLNYKHTTLSASSVGAVKEVKYF